MKYFLASLIIYFGFSLTKQEDPSIRIYSFAEVLLESTIPVNTSWVRIQFDPGIELRSSEVTLLKNGTARGTVKGLQSINLDPFNGIMKKGDSLVFEFKYLRTGDEPSTSDGTVFQTLVAE